VHAVRDTHGIDAKNPLPFFAVKQRIETALSVPAGRFVVVPLPNITNVYYGRDCRLHGRAHRARRNNRGDFRQDARADRRALKTIGLAKGSEPAFGGMLFNEGSV
jgi:hypothetical protein